ncbi:Rieske 2Fe-2S domain-containing protein [Streptomyces osmaniensis]|nr:Rieske (2Fe-2S) protein [Streptomyces sp. JCM17656]
MPKKMKITRRWQDYFVTPTGPTMTYREEAPPLPYAESWYMLAPSAEVQPGQVVTRRLMGSDVVVYRTRQGAVRALHPHCRHLGAHLGNGWVEGETIVCPFHHFAFDCKGEVAAVGAGYEGLPKHCKQPVLQVREANGGIFAWAGHGEPTWTIPQLLGPQHTTPKFRTFDLFTHPQEVLENAVDIRHVTNMHDYAEACLPKGSTPDKHTCSQTLRMTRAFPPFGKLTVDVDITLYGLGLFTGAIRNSEIGLEQFVQFIPRPTEPWRIHLAVGTSMLIAPSRGIAAHIPRFVFRALSFLVEPFYYRLALTDLNDDFQIWNGKAYINPPRIAAGEGPIGPFRMWARQFYPDTPLTLWPEAGRNEQ